MIPSQIEQMAIVLYVAGCGWPADTWLGEGTQATCRAFYRRLARAALAQLAAQAS